MGLATLAGLGALALGVCLGKPGAAAWLPACPFQKLTGLYCPGCGSTRMLYFLLHGHPLMALHENALTMVILPVALVALARQLGWRFELGSAKVRRMAFRGAIAAVLLFTIARNVPVYPLCELAPEAACRVR